MKTEEEYLFFIWVSAVQIVDAEHLPLLNTVRPLTEQYGATNRESFKTTWRTLVTLEFLFDPQPCQHG